MNTQLFEATRRVITSGEVYPGYPTMRLTLDKDDFSSDNVPELPKKRYRNCTHNQYSCLALVKQFW